MSHFAMFSIAAHGHVNPSLEVIRELVRRGHRVTYAIPGEKDFPELVRGAGAEAKVYRSVLPTDDDPDAWGTELIDNVEPFLNDAVQALPQLAAQYGNDRPDVVLADIAAYPARVLAHRWGVPIVQLSPAMVAWEGYEEEVGAGLVAQIKGSERGRAYYARWRAWLDENGLEGMDPDRFMGRPDRCLVLIPRALQPHADRVDPGRYTFVGACQGDRSHEGSWEPPAAAAGRKILVVSLGSTFTKQPAFYRACLDAFGGLPDWYVVLQHGRHLTPAALGPIPENAEVHPWIPQLAVLRHADAFITHAGAGGAQEGLATGTPMVCVPQAADQFGNAEMLAALGVARHVPTEEATPDVLREAVTTLVEDPDTAVRCAGERARVATEGGTQRAADLLEAAVPRG
ncbi:glycosyltransferase [Streptomyces sp. DSM 44917]|uniref:Glycosyltransferase n=1 Tax=Streptomyces boetiae TaxID=3075541 RepID=A0ABU2L717_9ACTN|nr:macrolide family glycosyltransferase [Streptomyces sp. DSM 44917]MDT0307359.1 glycosyltransferase [Streptomyces sp. DSM 44917]